ncbi:hypothetical protein SAMN04487969_12723 [Paenibacillus algorifonticola]|uniref:YtkA-like n=1 Tax=Paenibacillus algorifonticola TaxID=684063 RepID=A0A1I2HXT3_9BACL|nr:hypothetical protein [Paenibacillus algorifonticola]SFF33567.1 hypothetical protein SAMN04487969_12723 [Paenibacillus algorifonticola]
MAKRKAALYMTMIALAGMLAGCGTNGASTSDASTSGHEGHQQSSPSAAPEASESGAHSGHDENEQAESDNSHSGHGDMDGMEHEQANAQVKWSFQSGQPVAGSETVIELNVTDAADAPIEKFDLNHEKLMHLIAVSSDLSYFSHIHPNYESGGKFTVKETFPAADTYKLFADFIPSGAPQQTISTEVEASGQAAAKVELKADHELVQTVEGQKVKLALSTTKAGEEAKLTYTFEDAATGEPVTDLEPYLGAVGHVVIISGDLAKYLHVHPLDEAATGPEAVFATEFPEPGLYKIWGQFQRAGKTFIVPFVVNIQA